MTAGFVLLTATLAAGMLFSEGTLWPCLALGPQGCVLGAVVADLCGAAARTLALWLARPQRRAVFYTGAALLLLAYVGSRFALEVVLGAQRMKYLLVLVVVAVGYAWWRGQRTGALPCRAGARFPPPGHGGVCPLRRAPAALRSPDQRPAPLLLRRAPAARCADSLLPGSSAAALPGHGRDPISAPVARFS